MVWYQNSEHTAREMTREVLLRLLSKITFHSGSPRLLEVNGSLIVDGARSPILNSFLFRYIVNHVCFRYHFFPVAVLYISIISQRLLFFSENKTGQINYSHLCSCSIRSVHHHPSYVCHQGYTRGRASARLADPACRRIHGTG